MRVTKNDQRDHTPAANLVCGDGRAPAGADWPGLCACRRPSYSGPARVASRGRRRGAAGGDVRRDHNCSNLRVCRYNRCVWPPSSQSRPTRAAPRMRAAFRTPAWSTACEPAAATPSSSCTSSTGRGSTTSPCASCSRPRTRATSPRTSSSRSTGVSPGRASAICSSSPGSTASPSTPATTTCARAGSTGTSTIVSDTRAVPVDTFEQAEMTHLVEQTLGDLSERHRTVLVLKDIHGLRHDEIAEILGISRGATETLLFRARESFRTRYLELTSELPAPSCTFARDAAVSAVGGELSGDERQRILTHADQPRLPRDRQDVGRPQPSGSACSSTASPLPAALRAPSRSAATGAAAGGAARARRPASERREPAGAAGAGTAGSRVGGGRSAGVAAGGAGVTGGSAAGLLAGRRRPAHQGGRRRDVKIAAARRGRDVHRRRRRGRLRGRRAARTVHQPRRRRRRPGRTPAQPSKQARPKSQRDASNGAGHGDGERRARAPQRSAAAHAKARQGQRQTRGERQSGGRRELRGREARRPRQAGGKPGNANGQGGGNGQRQRQRPGRAATAAARRSTKAKPDKPRRPRSRPRTRPPLRPASRTDQAGEPRYAADSGGLQLAPPALLSDAGPRPMIRSVGRAFLNLSDRSRHRLRNHAVPPSTPPRTRRYQNRDR